MNKKSMAGVAVIGAMLLSPIITIAQSENTTPPREAASGLPTGKKDVAPEQRADVREKMTERIGELREKMAERRSEILKRIAERMIHRMEAAIERLTRISSRIDARIAKLKERGVDTAASEVLLATARQKLGDAAMAVENAKTAMADALSIADVDADGDGKMDKPDPGKTVREFLAVARDAVKAAHRALVDTIKSLKSSIELRGKAEANSEKTQ